MGPQKSQPKKEFETEINHPRFAKSKIVTEGEEKRLQTSFSVDEKEYDKWKLAVARYPSFPPNLLLPLHSSFSRTGMCGHTGTATVTPVPLRLTTTTTPTCSLRRSTTVMARRHVFRRWSCGF